MNKRTLILFLASIFFSYANERKRRRIEVFDRAPLPQELRIAHHSELVLPGLDLSDDLVDSLPGSNGHRALGNDHLEAVEVLADRGGDLLDEAQIGGAVRPRWGSHGNEDGLRLFDRRSQIGRESQAALVHVGANHRGQSGLVDGYLSSVQCINFFLVDIDTGDVGAEFCEAGTGYKAHVTGADHYYVHVLFVS